MQEALSTLPRNASTAVYVNKEGVRYAVYHCTKAGTAWQHSTQERCPACPVSTERAR